MLFRRDDSAARPVAIVSSSQDAVIGHGLDGLITSWNLASERLFHYTAHEAIGAPVDILIPGDRRGEEDYVRSRLSEGLDIGPFETIGRRKDGGSVEISVMIHATRDSHGEVIGASRIVRDISERRRIERDALRLAAIVEWSDDAIVGKDVNGIIQTWNKAAERIFGYTAAEAIGRSITMIIPEERHQEEANVLARIRAGQAVDHFETVRRRKDGLLIEVSLTVSPIRTPAGEIIGASKIARDITSQKRVQREMEEANRAKDQFLATLSHELRTPLNTVLGYTEMLRNDLLNETQRERALVVIARNAEALTKLVNDVLDTSRIVTGKLRLVLQPCDVGVIAEEAVDSLSPTAQTKGVTLTSAISPHQVVQGDSDRLRQILWNLLSNAVKFTPRGGRIVLTVEPRDKSVRIAVEDTGIGLTPETLPYVFHRFWQADAALTTAQGGLGLGLALARHFVELHGGQIFARSPGPGQGATFEVLLPAADTQ